MLREDLRLRLRLEGLVLADRRQKLVILEEIYPGMIITNSVSMVDEI